MAAKLDLPSLNILSRAAALSGCDLDAVLSAVNILPAAGQAPFQRLPLDHLEHLLNELDRRASRSPFAISFAQVFNFDGQPEVATYLLSIQTLRDANPVQEWVPRLIHPAIRLESQELGPISRTHVHVDDPSQQHSDMPAFVEAISAVIAQLCRQLAPDLPALKTVQFAHRRTDRQPAFEAFFGCPVHWGGKDNHMDFDSRVLDVTLPGSLPLAHAQAEQAIRQKLAVDGAPLPALIEETLRHNLELFSLGLEGLAEQLKMHPRSLQRQLRSKGQTYSDLLSRIRHRLACEMLLGSDLDIESIGIKLGFAERRSFTQAFRKWQGQTPSHFRRNAGQS